MKYYTLPLILIILALTQCDVSLPKDSSDSSTALLAGKSVILVKYSNSSEKPEILLQLVIENLSDSDLLIKNPDLRIINTETKEEISLYNLAGISLFDTLPTIRAYEDSIIRQLATSLSTQLIEFIRDSVSRKGIDFEKIESKDIYGYMFIKRKSSVVHLYDLTSFINRFRGKFAIFPYYDDTGINYAAKYVPEQFKGYHKSLEEIQFDTLLIQAEGKIWTHKRPFSVH